MTSVTGGRPFSQYLELIRELAITQFKLKYTGSLLGYVWSLAKPLMMFGIMYFVFARLLKIGAGVQDFPLQLLLAIVLYTFFSEATSGSVSAIVSNGGLIQRASFPRSVLIIATSMTALMTFLINTSLIIIIAAAGGAIHLGLRSLWAIPLLLELYVIIIGASLILSSLFVFYRDVGHIWEVISLIIMYASAIMYPVTYISHLHHFGTILSLNPILQIIEDMRHALITPTVPWTASITGHLFFVPYLLSVLLLVVGIFVFSKMSPHFAENV